MCEISIGGLGFRAQDLGFRAQGLGTSKYSSPYIVDTPPKRDPYVAAGMCVSDTCCWDSGFRVQGFKT